MARKESNQTNNQTKPRRQRVQHTYFALSLLGNDLTVLRDMGRKVFLKDKTLKKIHLKKAVIMEVGLFGFIT